MVRNPWSIKPVVFNPFGSKTKRTLGTREKQILYRRAKGRCEACGKKIDFIDMQAGHKNAASKGGSATLRNSVCLCYTCNKLQGTDSWATFMRKSGKSKTRSVTSGKKRKSKGRKRQGRGLGLFEYKPPKFDFGIQK